MSSLYNRVIIMVICRIMNYAVMFLSPIFMVRILDVYAYGQYREFLLYASLLASFVGFSIKRSILYFIPKSPENERNIVTNTALLILISWFIGIVFIYIGQQYIISKTSYNFITPLIIYLFFFLNLDILDTYWLANKRSDYVLFYSFSYVAGRVAAIVIAAYYWRNVRSVINAMIIFEALKCITGFTFLFWKKLFIFQIDLKIIREQLIYIVPLGLASILFFLSQQISKLIVLNKLGVEALAIYAIGSTQVPIINIVRSAISDVVFPEISQRNATDPLNGLKLWQKANVIYCFLVFPIFVIFFWYAKPIINILFTSEYISAIPIFKIYLLLLIRQCFELGSPIRAMNQNKYFVVGTLVAFLLNVIMFFPLLKYFGFSGPAFAYIISDYLAACYMAKKTARIYKVGIGQLFMWKKIAFIVLSCVMTLPILLLGKFVEFNIIVKGAICVAVYLVGYYIILRYFKINEIELLVNKVFIKFKRQQSSCY